MLLPDPLEPQPMGYTSPVGEYRVRGAGSIHEYIYHSGGRPHTPPEHTSCMIIYDLST